MLLPNRKIEPGDERGVALILTMMLMVVFSLLTLGMFNLLTTSTQISGNHRLDLRTTYIADAGMEDAINELRDSPDSLDGSTFSESFEDGTYTVTVENAPVTNPVAFYREKDITSKGTISGFERTIVAHVVIIDMGGTGYAVANTSWMLE